MNLDVMSNIRAGLPDYVRLMTVAAKDYMSGRGITFRVPPGFTSQLSGRGNYGLGALINRISHYDLAPFAKILSAPNFKDPVHGLVVRYKSEQFPSVAEWTSHLKAAPISNVTTTVYWWNGENKKKILDTPKDLDCLNGDVAPLIEIRNDTLATVEFMVCGLEELGETHNNSFVSLVLRLCRSSFLDSW